MSLVWGKALLAWFVERVCFYAYGPQLAKRIAYATMAFRGHSCNCGYPLWRDRPVKSDRVCAICFYDEVRQRSPAMQRTDTPSALFFEAFTKHLLALRFPQRYLILRSMQCGFPEGSSRYRLCTGCQVYFDTLSNNKVIHCAHDGSVLYCGASWCRLERRGLMHCSSCREQCCARCLGYCGICDAPGSCSDCSSRYECESCTEEAPKRWRCVDHAVQRFAFRETPADEVQWLCAEHLSVAEHGRRLKRIKSVE